MRQVVFFGAVFVFISALVGVDARAQEVALSGLKDRVRVSRDARSIPYIEAKSDADLYFAQGYTVASDRLWQMDLMRRVARGETAEIFGNTTLEEDKRWRRFNFAAVAEENLRYLSPELRSALDSYAAGVNAYIASLTPANTPVEFAILQYKPRNWTAADTVIVGKILADALSTTWRNDLTRAAIQGLPKELVADLTRQETPYDVILFGRDDKRADTAEMPGVPGISDQVTAIADREDEIRRSSLEKVGLYAEELAASNNWVISGKRTTDGKAILANDPHLAPTAPGIWYLVHLATPTMRVAGVTLPGVPGVILGHNDAIAWGATNVGPDVQDIFIESFNEKGEVAVVGGFEMPQRRKETIQVRSAPLSPATQPVEFEVVVTRNGPVIFEDQSGKYALKWTALDPKNTEFEAFFRLNRAKSWDDFKAALRTYGGATQNFVYADVKGNIGWYAAGRIPIRRTGDGAFPYKGSTNDGDWVGFIPFEELPNLYNPPSGLIVTANQRIVGNSYKYRQMSRDVAPPWRARRLVDLLDKPAKLSVDDSSAAQMDDYAIPLRKFADAAMKVGGLSDTMAASLTNWDGRMTPDSRGALLVNEMRGCVASTLGEVAPRVPVTFVRERVLLQALDSKASRWLPKAYADYSKVLEKCETSVVADLNRRYGPDTAKWTWRAVSAARFPHPLAVAPLIGAQFATPRDALRGAGYTPNVASGVSMRHVTSPGNWDSTRFVIPLGQSGDPKSPHYKDQFEAWKNGSPALFPFTESAVSAAARSTTVLTPR